MLSVDEKLSFSSEVSSKTAEQRFGKLSTLLVKVAKHTYFEKSAYHELTDGMRTWVLNKCDIQEKFHLKRSFFKHVKNGKLMLLSEFVRFTNWIFSHYPTEEVRLKAWMHLGSVLFCNTKENDDYGWHPFSRPLDQIFEDLVEKEVKKRVAEELRIRSWKKAQGEIGKG